MTRGRRLRERQAVVFGLLAAALVLTGVGSLLIYSGAVAAPFDRGFSSAEDDSPYKGVPQPCLPKDTLPVNPADIRNITVLNASGRAGLAKAVSKELINRGFTFATTGNISTTEDTGGVFIRFGEGGAAAAYTVGAQFESPRMLLDARADDPATDVNEGASLDIVVGSTFAKMRPADSVTLDTQIPLQNPAHCTAIAKIKPLPVLPTPTPTATEVPQPAAG